MFFSLFSPQKAIFQCYETAFKLTDTTGWQQSNELLALAEPGNSSGLIQGINTEDTPKKQKKVTVHCKSVAKTERQTLQSCVQLDLLRMLCQPTAM